MLEINIPGDYGKLKIKNLVFDYNGTLAIDGKLIPNAKEKLIQLSEIFKIFIITADTFSTAKENLIGVNCELIIIPSENQAQYKLEHLLKIGVENTIVFGNGNNDKLILKEAKIGIALIQAEGACNDAILNADIISNNIIDALELIINIDRLIATLRN